MEISVLVLVMSFIILLAMNVPIAISIGISTVLTMLFTIAPGYTVFYSFGILNGPGRYCTTID
jgi:hypothetical protein